MRWGSRSTELALSYLLVSTLWGVWQNKVCSQRTCSLARRVDICLKHLDNQLERTCSNIKMMEPTINDLKLKSGTICESCSQWRYHKEEDLNWTFKKLWFAGRKGGISPSRPESKCKEGMKARPAEEQRVTWELHHLPYKIPEIGREKFHKISIFGFNF